MQGSAMLSWEKIDAIPGWFMFQSYCVWRALLDQQARITGDLFEIGVWRGRSASVLASYRKGGEKLYLCDLRLDEEAVQRAIRSVGAEPVNIVPLSGPSADLPARLDLQAMHQTVRWFHIDGEHTGTAVSANSSGEPHRQSRRHHRDRRFILAPLSGKHHRSHPLLEKNPL